MVSGAPEGKCSSPLENSRVSRLRETFAICPLFPAPSSHHRTSSRTGPGWELLPGAGPAAVGGQEGGGGQGGPRVLPGLPQPLLSAHLVGCPTPPPPPTASQGQRSWPLGCQEGGELSPPSPGPAGLSLEGDPGEVSFQKETT